MISFALRTASKLRPAYSRQLRDTITSIVGIREIPNCVTQQWDAKMLAYRWDGGGGVVAKRSSVMGDTR